MTAPWSPDAAQGQGGVHEGGHGLAVGDLAARHHGEHLAPRHAAHLADALGLLLCPGHGRQVGRQVDDLGCDADLLRAFIRPISRHVPAWSPVSSASLTLRPREGVRAVGPAGGHLDRGSDRVPVDGYEHHLVVVGHRHDEHRRAPQVHDTVDALALVGADHGILDDPDPRAGVHGPGTQ